MRDRAGVRVLQVQTSPQLWLCDIRGAEPGGCVSCVHEEMVRQSGQAFDGELSRNFSGVVKLSAAADGFNNHK